jgi:hypothetical protein
MYRYRQVLGQPILPKKMHHYKFRKFTNRMICPVPIKHLCVFPGNSRDQSLEPPLHRSPDNAWGLRAKGLISRMPQSGRSGMNS